MALNCFQVPSKRFIGQLKAEVNQFMYKLISGKNRFEMDNKSHSKHCDAH